jgi:hypothetical protein
MISGRRRIAPLAVAAGLGIVTAGGGCNLVVGSADYKVGISGDSGMMTGTDAGPMEDGSMPPPPDGSTPPPPDGATTDATTQPDTGVPPVDSGMAGMDSGPGCLPSNDPNFQQLVRACVLAVACDPLFFDVTVSDCITRDFLHSYLSSDCLSKITSCDGYFACTGSRVTNATECQGALDAGSATGSCNGTVATTCFSDGSGIITDCAVVGGTCTVYTDSFLDQGARCVIANNCSSANDDGARHCASATQVFTCGDTSTSTVYEIARQTCPAGSTCQSYNGTAGCYATQSSCTTAGASCTNGNLTTCLGLSSGNQQYTSNCGAAGLQCATGLGTGTCTAGAGCSTGGCTEACSGNELQVCIGGAPYLVDCPSLGLSTCASTTDSVTNLTFNFCTN